MTAILKTLLVVVMAGVLAACTPVADERVSNGYQSDLGKTDLRSAIDLSQGI